MTISMRLGLYAVLVLAARPAPAAAQQGTDALEHGRALTRMLFQEQVDSLFAQFAEPFRRTVGGRDGLAAFAAQVAQLGAETGLAAEDTAVIGSTTFYDRIAHYAQVPGTTVTVSWGWQAGTVVRGAVRPTPKPAASAHLDYRTVTPLRLPFDGEWTVAWGGRQPHRNYHVVTPDQRFAYDLLVVRDGNTHTGTGVRNEEYHCFGRPILAPGAGAVVTAVDTLADNTPGAMLPAAPAGNHVILDHGNGEYSLLAHLRSGSVRIGAGDRVAAGDTIGECGNSGNSSEPHLHYHLQDAPGFGAGAGLPASFTDYVADDEPVERGEPVRGQRIRPREGGR